MIKPTTKAVIPSMKKIVTEKPMENPPPPIAPEFWERPSLQKGQAEAADAENQRKNDRVESLMTTPPISPMPENHHIQDNRPIQDNE